VPNGHKVTEYTAEHGPRVIPESTPCAPCRTLTERVEFLECEIVSIHAELVRREWPRRKAFEVLNALLSKVPVWLVDMAKSRAKKPEKKK